MKPKLIAYDWSSFEIGKSATRTQKRHPKRRYLILPAERVPMNIRQSRREKKWWALWRIK